MNIKTAMELEKEIKGFIVVAKIKWIDEEKHITGSKNGKDYDFRTLDMLIEDDSGSVYCQVSNPDFGKEKKGETISLISCSINEYTSKTGELKRKLKTNEFSFDVIPETNQQELPPTSVIEDKPITTVIPESESASPLGYKLTPREQEEREHWKKKDIKKDLLIIRQHCETDATSLIAKFFKGTLEEAITKTILVSNMLVSNIYQGLEYPIKQETTKKEELLADIKAGSDQNVKDYEMDALDKKALNLKLELNKLTGSDIEYGWILKEFDFDLNQKQKAEFVTALANKTIELQRG